MGANFIILPLHPALQKDAFMGSDPSSSSDSWEMPVYHAGEWVTYLPIIFKIFPLLWKTTYFRRTYRIRTAYFYADIVRD